MKLWENMTRLEIKFVYSEQRRSAEILSATDRKLERRRKEKLERVKKGLMNELLTGRKRVKVENDGNIY